MIRAIIYLLLAGVVWLAEGSLFSWFLQFALWQTALMVLVYVALFVGAAFWLVRLAGRAGDHQSSDLPLWRYLSLAPMVVAIVGSFLSLPILLGILALGRLV